MWNSPSMLLLYVILGVITGILSGILGIGGGIVLVPALVYLFGLTQHEAQGTTLALLVPPIGILAAWTYYKHGYVNLKIAGLICLGFVLGGLLGAKLAIKIPDTVLRKIFGGAFALIALQMIFK